MIQGTHLASSRARFHPGVLQLDLKAEADRIAKALRHAVLDGMKRKGVVVAISGGIDSACCAALAVHALGSQRVYGLFLPERDSSPESEQLGRKLAQKLGIEAITEDIAPALEGLGCYRRRAEAVRRVFPAFGPGWKFKIALSGSPLQDDRLNLFRLVIEDPSGKSQSERLPTREYLEIVAATNMKQRVRKLFEYTHAERLHYAVIGTPNRLEYDQGFFVKGGDGLADFKPIAHLYKTQVYAMAAHLGVIPEICQRAPTTDTYSLAQSQEEFYFSVPYPQMDLILWGKNHGVPAAEVGQVMGFSAEQVERVYRDIERKRATTMYLHLPPVLADKVGEIDAPAAAERMRG